jgi:hypothetical protein
MMPFPLIDDRPRTNRSRRRSAGNASTRARSLTLRPRAPHILPARLRPKDERER